MSVVELIYDADCPNVDAARAQLLRAFAAVELPPQWREWVRGAPESLDHAATYGSPTILVDGCDVAPMATEGGACCRLYLDEGRWKGVPPLDAIVSALRGAGAR